MTALPKPKLTSAPANGAPSNIDRVWAIEGARAWLAWTVVAAHLAQITGLVYTHAGWRVLSIAATQAVYMFIIISGFVITGLLLTRRESWTAYITRRAFRLFPAYLIALAFAAFAIFLGLYAIDYMSWGANPLFRFAETHPRSVSSVTAAPWAHALLDITLMQGAAPDNLLMRAQTAVLGPAWSLSLEWQFYLIAPALLWLLLNGRTRVAAIAGAFAVIGLFRLGVFGAFDLPSFLPGALHLFLIGITSRLGLDALKERIASPAAIALGFAGLAALFHDAAAVFLWGALMVFIATTQWRDLPSARRLVSILLESPLARALGARSYAVYILHYPIILTAAYLILPLGAFDQVQALAWIGAATIATTLLLSDLMYRFVEQPMIRLGARIASARATRTGPRLDETMQARTP